MLIVGIVTFLLDYKQSSEITPNISRSISGKCSTIVMHTTWYKIRFILMWRSCHKQLKLLKLFVEISSASDSEGVKGCNDSIKPNVKSNVNSIIMGNNQLIRATTNEKCVIK